MVLVAAQGLGSFEGYSPLVEDLGIGYAPQDIRVHMAAGAVGSDSAEYAEFTRKVIYKWSNILSTGLKIAGIHNMTTLEETIQWMGNVDIDYPVAPWARGFRRHVDWYQVSLILRKAVAEYEILDEATLHGRNQAQQLARKHGEAFATTIDTNIVANLIAGIYAVGKDVGTQNKWDGTGTNAPDIAGDIATALGVLWDQTERREALLEQDLFVLAPIKAKPFLAMPDMIQNIKTTTRDWLTGEWGITFYYTRNTSYANDIVLGYGGEETIIFGQLVNAPFPLSETYRVHGVGTGVVARKYFDSKIMPYAMGQTTSKNLVTITDIFTD